MQARRIDTARFSFDPSDSAGNSAARRPMASLMPFFFDVLVVTATAGSVSL